MLGEAGEEVYYTTHKLLLPSGGQPITCPRILPGDTTASTQSDYFTDFPAKCIPFISVIWDLTQINSNYFKSRRSGLGKIENRNSEFPMV